MKPNQIADMLNGLCQALERMAQQYRERYGTIPEDQRPKLPKMDVKLVITLE